MKVFIVLSLVALVVAQEAYDDKKYDNFNVDELIGNTRLLKAYCHCFLGDGKCTPEGADFKSLIPEAVSNNCAKCSEGQKGRVAKVIKAIKENLNEEYVALVKIYASEAKHRDSVDNFVKNYAA